MRKSCLPFPADTDLDCGNSVRHECRPKGETVPVILGCLQIDRHNMRHLLRILAEGVDAGSAPLRWHSSWGCHALDGG